jgi:poly(A) polymerase
MAHAMDRPPDPRGKPACDRQDALGVLKRLRESGHEAYFAGGCVRDTLLGLTPKDWDIATDAPPARVRELFADTQAVGAAFGVILVRQGKSVIEVATFRADGPYEDGRRPVSVRFASAKEDAQRRDFTINGLFFDPLEDRVIDYVGGREDLAARRLAAIGDAYQRFAEDHLRLLRAVRFAARFDLNIDPPTAAAIRELADRLKGISPERIGDELRLMLMPTTRNLAWKLVWDLKLGPVLFRFLPMIPNSIDAKKSLFPHLVPTESISFGLSVAAATLCVRMQAEPSVDPRTFFEKPEITRSVRAVRQALRLSNSESEEMAEILDNLRPLLADAMPTLAIKKRFMAKPTAMSSRWLLESLAQIDVQAERIAILRPDLAALEHLDVSPTPLLTGDDLTAAGWQPSPKFKQVLDAVYDAQLEGKISTRQEAIQLAEQW